MSSISPASPRRLEDLLHEIDSYASLITKDFIADGRRIKREFVYEGELFIRDGKPKYLGQTCLIDLPDEGIRFSVEVTEIFRSYLPQDERGEMRWTSYFNTRPDLREIAITQAFERIYPPAVILHVLTPTPPRGAQTGTSLPSPRPQSVSLTGSSASHPTKTTPAAPPLPQISRPPSAKAGHFNFTAPAGAQSGTSLSSPRPQIVSPTGRSASKPTETTSAATSLPPLTRHSSEKIGRFNFKAPSK